MGVPGFFAWLLKNYRNNNIITANITKDIDWLYLDSNCLFHPQCYKILNFYTELKNLEKLENKMIKRILNYIDYLIGIANPKKGVFISVDGVAPMAKMSQQRKRRQKAIQDNAIRDDIKKKYGKSSSTIWNNTTITPGTAFMEKLHLKILEYIKENRIKLNIAYVYSSYHTVGEGEHKILQDIKEKNLKQEFKDDVYAIYGLDADLIFLALASGKNNIYLLREETFLRGGDRAEKEEIVDIVNDVAEDLNFVSIDETKKCINEQIKHMIDKKMDFDELNGEYKYLDINYDNVDFTNDFIMICYFLGNDFIPNLPSIDIKNDGLNLLLDVFAEIYLMTGHTLVIGDEQLSINDIFMNLYMEKISSFEDYYFKVKYPKYVENIAKRKCQSDDPFDKEIWDFENLKNIKIVDPIKLGYDEQSLWKFRYYEYYYGVSIHQQEHINEMCKDFMRGIKWTFRYYFDKCASWTWFYKYTNSPFVSDLSKFIKNTKYNINKIEFKKSEPLNPIVQLLAVLPPNCAELLPDEYGKLMSHKLSPILDLYPTEVFIDTLYKDSLHKCVPLIPNINIDRILNATKNIELNQQEKVRNIIGNNFIINH